MVTIGYFDGTKRCGLLAWREPVGSGRVAIGGIDATGEPTDPRTVISTDDGEAQLAGWLHPDRVFVLLEADELTLA